MAKRATAYRPLQSYGKENVQKRHGLRKLTVPEYDARVTALLDKYFPLPVAR